VTIDTTAFANRLTVVTVTQVNRAGSVLPVAGLIALASIASPARTAAVIESFWDA